MAMLVEPLGLTTPIAGFNGGMFVKPDMTPIDPKTLPEALVGPVLRAIGDRRLDAWVYQGSEWFVRDTAAPHVAREQHNVQFPPTVTTDLEQHDKGIVKIVGVSDDLPAVEACAQALRDLFGDEISAARSQPYYVDVTHPQANKGEVVRCLSKRLNVPMQRIATIGDMPNDVLMFAVSGLGIAMGNASPDVQRSARRVTSSNVQEGFAEAVERSVLPKTSFSRNAKSPSPLIPAEPEALRP
jgi:Cof subfamily protein (haloacid dehalogenase superfamily)